VSLLAIDDPSRIRRSRDVGAYLGLVPKRYQSGEVDYVGGISKCGDGRVQTLPYEAANVMLTRYNGQLKLKEWAFAIARRSSVRKARIALARRLAIIMHAMVRDGTEFVAGVTDLSAYDPLISPAWATTLRGRARSFPPNRRP
jgi:transposase